MPEGAWLVSPAIAIGATSYGWTTNMAYVVCDSVLRRSLRRVWGDVGAVTTGAIASGLVLTLLETQPKAKPKGL